MKNITGSCAELIKKEVDTLNVFGIDKPDIFKRTLNIRRMQYLHISNIYYISILLHLQALYAVCRTFAYLVYTLSIIEVIILVCSHSSYIAIAN